MARRISRQLLAALEWENLLGLDKESREIKDLCSRRRATHYIVLSDVHNLRVAGLLAALPHPADDDYYSLAALLCLRAAGQPLLFVYALPALPPHSEPPKATDSSNPSDQVIVIAIQGGRPTMDRVLPRDEALHEATLFAETLDGTVRLFGNVAIDGLDVSAMALPDAVALSDAERTQCRIQALSGSRANNLVKNGAAALLIIGTMTTLAWLLWPAQRVYVAPVVTIDEQAAYYAALDDARNKILAGPGYAHITEIQQLLAEVPVVVDGWRAKTLRCTTKTCDIAWERGQGATLEGLLNSRPNARIQEDNYDNAIESIVSLTSAESESASIAQTPLIILPRLEFYEIANARASTLKDHGMEAEIGIATPLVPMPAGMINARKTAERHTESDTQTNTQTYTQANPQAHPQTHTNSAPIAKGDWRIAGHLAFLDSVTGLLLRTGNMRLNTVDIDTDPVQPRFTASGYFYVE